jgi:probable F420-dependent oxidoreductase
MRRESTITRDDVAAWRDRMGPAGVWLSGSVRGPRLKDAAAAIERLGLGALWIGGSNPDPRAFSDLAGLLESTSELVVASGIANIWAWDPAAMHATVNPIDTAYPGRLVVGLGVSHQRSVPQYHRPLAAMRDFLDGLDRAAAEAGTRPAFRVIAALRRRMLELARDRSGGSHPYFTPPAHTAVARQELGPDRLLAPEQAVVVEPDPVRARAVARQYMAVYLTLPNYVNNLRELGFDDEDFADGGSDRLVDTIIAWGDADQVAARVREHLDAGADHVAIQPLGSPEDLGLEQLRRLAPALVPR